MSFAVSQDLREKREELNRQILKEEEDKAKIQKDLGWSHFLSSMLLFFSSFLFFWGGGIISLDFLLANPPRKSVVATRRMFWNTAVY